MFESHHIVRMLPFFTLVAALCRLGSTLLVASRCSLRLTLERVFVFEFLHKLNAGMQPFAWNFCIRTIDPNDSCSKRCFG